MNLTKSRGLKNPGVKIIGTGGFLPGQPISNQDLLRQYPLDTTDYWIRENLGIKTRHFAESNLAASHLGYEAAKIALKNANISAKDLDRILFCSSTSDWTSPAAACNVQALLGADCPCEDKQAACSSFIYGLDHAIYLIASGLNFVLVIGSDVKSRFVKKDDLRLMPIFADGAGAFVLTKSNSSDGFLLCELWADGTKVQNLVTPAGGSAMPASQETVSKDLHKVHMNVEGREIFNNAVYVMTELSRQICRECNIQTSSIDVFIPHQANLSIMKAVANNLGIPIEKTILTIQDTGNIVAGTLPYAMNYAYNAKRISKGDLVLLVTAGAGYSAGAALYREV